MELPKDLGGYQQVVFGDAKVNDIVCRIEGKYPDCEPWMCYSSSVVQVNAMGGWHEYLKHILLYLPHCRVYRKMACPQNDGEVQTSTPDDSIPPIEWEYIRDNDDPNGEYWNMGNPSASTPNEAKVELPDDGKAKTYDDGKPPLAWLPWAGIRAVADVQAYGHSKYHDFNNYRKGMEVSRNLSCAMRHIGEYMEGNDLDKESKKGHLAHAACRILFVIQNLSDGTAIDDRYKKA